MFAVFVDFISIDASQVLCIELRMLVKKVKEEEDHIEATNMSYYYLRPLKEMRSLHRDSLDKCGACGWIMMLILTAVVAGLLGTEAGLASSNPNGIQRIVSGVFISIVSLVSSIPLYTRIGFTRRYNPITVRT